TVLVLQRPGAAVQHRHGGGRGGGELRRRRGVAAGRRHRGGGAGRPALRFDDGRVDRRESRAVERGYRRGLRARVRRPRPPQRALIVNAPNATPRSTPSPVPASASETSPLVITWALLDFTTPAWASALA